MASLFPIFKTLGCLFYNIFILRLVCFMLSLYKALLRFLVFSFYRFINDVYSRIIALIKILFTLILIWIHTNQRAIILVSLLTYFKRRWSLITVLISILFLGIRGIKVWALLSSIMRIVWIIRNLGGILLRKGVFIWLRLLLLNDAGILMWREWTFLRIIILMWILQVNFWGMIWVLRLDVWVKFFLVRAFSLQRKLRILNVKLWCWNLSIVNILYLTSHLIKSLVNGLIQQILLVRFILLIKNLSSITQIVELYSVTWRPLYSSHFILRRCVKRLV